MRRARNPDRAPRTDAASAARTLNHIDEASHPFLIASVPGPPVWHDASEPIRDWDLLDQFEVDVDVESHLDLFFPVQYCRVN